MPLEERHQRRHRERAVRWRIDAPAEELAEFPCPYCSAQVTGAKVAVGEDQEIFDGRCGSCGRHLRAEWKTEELRIFNRHIMDVRRDALDEAGGRG